MSICITVFNISNFFDYGNIIITFTFPKLYKKSLEWVEVPTTEMSNSLLITEITLLFVY